LATYDSSFANREVAAPVPRAAEYTEERESPEHFDSEQTTVEPVTNSSSKNWKTRFGIVFFILLAILTRGPQLLKLFQPKRQPVIPVARPVKKARDPNRKLGEELAPPEKPILDKFKKANGEPPAAPGEKRE
jgi:hypothetical protein